MSSKSRKVKCMATGQIGTNTEFFKAPNGRYFKSEEIYESWMEGRRKAHSKPAVPRYEKPGRTAESYKKLCDTIADLIGYVPGGQPMPTVVFRRLKELDFYSDEIIQETFDDCRPDIEWAFKTKVFDGDSVKASYMMAIIRNRIAEIYRREKRRNELRYREEYKLKNENDFDEMVDLENVGVVQKSRDVSSLLGGDDLWI